MIGFPDENFLDKYELSRDEYIVLDSVEHMMGRVIPERIPPYAQAIMDHTVSLDRYHKAVESCLIKGWLRILSQADCEEDRTRWENDDNQFISGFDYQEGNTDFTPQRGLLFDQISSEWLVRRGMKPYSGYGQSQKIPNQVRIFSAYEANLLLLVENVERTRKEDLHWLGESVRIVGVEGPEQISNWWINRFVQLPIGYRAIFHTSNS